jgi:hypothetical protein
MGRLLCKRVTYLCFIVIHSSVFRGLATDVGS